MKLVREHINEKFRDDSDPIRDMNIGIWVPKVGDKVEIKSGIKNNTYVNGVLFVEPMNFKGDNYIRDISGNKYIHLDGSQYNYTKEMLELIR